MAGEVVYIGDEIEVAGFRLAGTAVRAPERGQEAAVLREELGRAALVILSRAVAERVELRELVQALASPSPLVIVLPDTAGVPGAIDVAARVRLQLGIGQA
jgi:vacuolar-type H+-ATPase subunit F/Vma7